MFLSIRRFHTIPSLFQKANFIASPETISKFFHISYARSSGAGGQHVNTTDSKAIIRLSSSEWYASRSKWIPADTFDNIMRNLNDNTAPQTKKFPYFTQAGDVLIMSSNTRYRDKNLHECFEKFINAVDQCGTAKEELSEETKKHWDKLKKRENEVRLKEKKLKKDKKTFRKSVSLGDY